MSAPLPKVTVMVGFRGGIYIYIIDNIYTPKPTFCLEPSPALQKKRFTYMYHLILFSLWKKPALFLINTVHTTFSFRKNLVFKEKILGLSSMPGSKIPPKTSEESYFLLPGWYAYSCVPNQSPPTQASDIPFPARLSDSSTCRNSCSLFLRAIMLSTKAKITKNTKKVDLLGGG